MKTTGLKSVISSIARRISLTKATVLSQGVVLSLIAIPMDPAMSQQRNVLSAYDTYIVSQIPNLYDKEKRRKFASNLAIHFKKLDSSFADVTPDERLWLKKNYYDKISQENTFTPQTLQVMESKIYSVATSKDFIEDILKSLNRLTDQHNSLGVDIEIILWGDLSLRLARAADFVGNIQVLSQSMPSIRKVFGPNETYSSLELYAPNLALRSSEITENILLPYLLSKINR